MMEWMNFNHLYYFWIVASEGSIARASDRLLVAPPTISAQLRALERSLGEVLFERTGRGLALTDVGRTAYHYADEMFATSREMIDTIRGRPTGRPLQLGIGVIDNLPKLVAYRLIKPALELPEPVQFNCREGRPETLYSELAVHGLDVVLSDAPIGPEIRVKAFNHLLGECDVTILGAPQLAAQYRKGFPESLDNAPMLLPNRTAALRRDLDQWFESKEIRPLIRGELDDLALLKVFGQAGEGLFAIPSVIEAEVRHQYRVRMVGRINELRERFFAISVERKLKHPAVLAICETARRAVFAEHDLTNRPGSSSQADSKPNY